MLFRREPYRSGGGPQAGAEGARRGGCSAARPPYAHSDLCPGVVDREYFSPTAFFRKNVAIGWIAQTFHLERFQGRSAVPVRPGVPSVLSAQREQLASPGYQFTFRAQHHPVQPAQRNWIWTEDPPLFRWIPGKGQQDFAGSNARGRYKDELFFLGVFQSYDPLSSMEKCIYTENRSLETSPPQDDCHFVPSPFFSNQDQIGILSF